MDIRIVKEAGYHEALEGMTFSFKTECKLDEMENDYKKNMKTARTLAHKDGGHNKFLESMIIWVDIRASLTWWKQADTYRVGMTKLSKSTMHTLMRRRLTRWDFNNCISDDIIERLNTMIDMGAFEKVIDYLPGAYMQTRRCCMNYKTLRNMISQRRGHKLPEWKDFIEGMLWSIKYPELVEKD